MKRLLTLVSISFSILALAGCSRNDLLQWSPDGKTFTIVKDNELKVGTPDGKLSGTLADGVEFARWLPDSRRALVSASHSTTSWPELAKLLTPAEQSEIKKMANRIWLKRYIFENQPHQIESVLYLRHTYGDTAFKLRFKKLLADIKGVTPSAEINEIKLVDLSDPSAPKRQLLWQTAKEIEDLRISPDGKLAALSIKADQESKIVVLPLTGNHAITAVATNASKPDWSNDGRTLYFVALTKFDGAKPYDEVLSKVREPYQEKVLSVEVVDTAGRLLPIPKVAKTIATVLADGTNQVRCLADGSIVFDGKQKAYPSIGDEESNDRAQLFRVKSDLKSIAPIAGSSELPKGSLSSFEPNKDGTFISGYGNKGEVSVLEVSSGKVTNLEPANKRELSFAPQWRTKDELCYLTKQNKLAGGHDYDLILQSVKDFNERSVLTKDWSLNDFPFLKKQEEEKDIGKTKIKEKR